MLFCHNGCHFDGPAILLHNWELRYYLAVTIFLPALFSLFRSMHRSFSRDFCLGLRCWFPFRWLPIMLRKDLWWDKPFNIVLFILILIIVVIVVIIIVVVVVIILFVWVSVVFLFSFVVVTIVDIIQVCRAHFHLKSVTPPSLNIYYSFSRLTQSDIKYIEIDFMIIFLNCTSYIPSS